MNKSEENNNYVSRFLFDAHDIRGTLIRLDSAWQAMQRGRNYPLAAAHLLGDMASVTVLIASQLKQPGRITFQAKGDGAVSLLVMDCDEHLRLRGMVRMDQQVAATDQVLTAIPASVPLLLGQGQLILTLEPTAIRHQPYQSIVPLEGATLSDVFAHYLAQSEQQDTWLKLTTTPEICAGLFLQRLPVSVKAKDEDAWNRVTQLADTVRDDELLHLSAGTILKRLFGEEDVRLFPPLKAQYHCPYDREKVAGTLRSLGRDELMRILAEEGEVAVHDEICNHYYNFSKDDIDMMFSEPQKKWH